MRATLLMGEAAQVADNKLNVLGAGMNIMRPETNASIALGVLFHVPWAEAEKPHNWTVELCNKDGSLMIFADNQTLRVEGTFTMDEVPSIARTAPLVVPVALAIGALPLPIGIRAQWVVKDADSKPIAAWPFTTVSEADIAGGA